MIKLLETELAATDDWTKMEYSFYVLRGHGLDERAVMHAVLSARRRFFLRPKYLWRHAWDLPRLVLTKHHVVKEVLMRFLIGAR